MGEQRQKQEDICNATIVIQVRDDGGLEQVGSSEEVDRLYICFESRANSTF